MAENSKQPASGSGIRPAPCPCADRSCRFFSGTQPMCSRCYEEKVAKPMEELEAALAEIRRVNSGKQHVALGQPRTRPVPAVAAAAAEEAWNVASGRCRCATFRRKVGVRNCS